MINEGAKKTTDRLTERIGDYIQVKGNKPLYSCQERNKAYLQNAIISLAAYEDTGLEPEEIQELLHQELWSVSQEADGGVFELDRFGQTKERKMTVKESRALAVAINSLRFNPDLSDIEVQSYEMALMHTRDRVQEETGGVLGDISMRVSDGNGEGLHEK